MAQEVWQPDTRRIPPNKRIPIRVHYGEETLGKQIKAAGGTWNARKKVWEVPYRTVIELELTGRIVRDQPDAPDA